MKLHLKIWKTPFILEKDEFIKVSTLYELLEENQRLLDIFS